VFDAIGAGAGASGNPAAWGPTRPGCWVGAPRGCSPSGWRPRAGALRGAARRSSRDACRSRHSRADSSGSPRVAASTCSAPARLGCFPRPRRPRAWARPPHGSLRPWASPGHRAGRRLAVLGRRGSRPEPSPGGKATAIGGMIGAGGELIAEADAVIVEEGLETRGLGRARLSAVRGQASWTDGVADHADGRGVGGYVITDGGGLCCSAPPRPTTNRSRCAVAGSRRKPAGLAEGRAEVAARLAGATWRRAAVRVAPRPLPVAGPAPDGPPRPACAGGRRAGLHAWAPLLASTGRAIFGVPSPLAEQLDEIGDRGFSPARGAGGSNELVGPIGLFQGSLCLRTRTMMANIALTAAGSALAATRCGQDKDRRQAARNVLDATPRGFAPNEHTLKAGECARRYQFEHVRPAPTSTENQRSRWSPRR